MELTREQIQVTEKYNQKLEAGEYRAMILNPESDLSKLKSEALKIMNEFYDTGIDYDTNESVLEINGLRVMICKNYNTKFGQSSIEHFVEVK